MRGQELTAFSRYCDVKNGSGAIYYNAGVIISAFVFLLADKETLELGKVFSTLMQTRARYVLFETSNPRHAHEWTVFRDRSAEIPDEKVLVPGVVDTTTNFVEHPELVAQRLERFVNIVGVERLIAGSDCGFGTFAGFGAVDPDIAYAKLASLAEGTNLASSRLVK